MFLAKDHKVIFIYLKTAKVNISWGKGFQTVIWTVKYQAPEFIEPKLGVLWILK